MDLVDRRRADDRRLANLGPPTGLSERRLNVERRIFDLGPLVAKTRFPAGTTQRTIVREGRQVTPPAETEFHAGFVL